jgi:hypothetical protein
MADLKGGTTGQYLVKQSNTDMDFTWTTNTADIDGITATSPLTGGGTSGTITVGIQDGTTAQKGAVQLTNSTSSTSTTTAATPSSVKTAYDLADAAIPKSLVDAKGDLIAATGNDVPARLAVGNNGDTLVADSAASTGLRWQGNYAAGKNKIINGDFNINQRSFTSSTSASATYGFDRWLMALSGATGTYSAETFTLGTAPVAGYEAKNFARLAVTTGNDFAGLIQRIESVRTFAGQTMTVSFWAKGTNPTTAGKLSLQVEQVFGTGGSPSASVAQYADFTLTANWTRYSLTFNVASISGKTLGTNNDDYLSLRFGQGTSTSTDAWTLDLWGVQAEAGNVATAFQTATGTLQGELAACQRYYLAKFNGVGRFNTTTTAQCYGMWPVPMRTAPSLGATTSGDVGEIGTALRAISAINTSALSANGGYITFTTASATSGAMAGCYDISVQLSAEL